MGPGEAAGVSSQWPVLTSMRSTLEAAAGEAEERIPGWEPRLRTPHHYPKCYRINLDGVQLLSRWSHAGATKEPQFLGGKERKTRRERPGTLDSSGEGNSVPCVYFLGIGSRIPENL